jgi:glycosyltransferase involved in cell wall biosynthesis
MRIGIDGSCLANRRGFGRFARESLAALARLPRGHDFVVFVDRPSAEFAGARVPEPFARVVVDVSEAPSRAASAAGRRRLRDMLAMGRAVARAKVDLIFFPASYSFFPVWNVKHVIVAIHDTLPLVHPELVFPTWQGRVSWVMKERAAVHWASRIVTVSEAARRDLIAWYRLPAGKVRVVSEGPDSSFRPVPPGPDSDAALARYGLQTGQRYILYVGGLSPHKNLLRLIAAFARTVEGGAARDVKLVLAGDLGDTFHTHIPELRAAVMRYGLGDRVMFPGFIADEDLVHLYSRAYALVQPSLLEGFGLPPVEAMACGVPVLYSQAGSLPEVVGDGGLAFEPTDVAAMAGVLGRVLTDRALRDRLGRQALHRAQRFSWTATARALHACFDEFDPGRAWTRRISA